MLCQTILKLKMQDVNSEVICICTRKRKASTVVETELLSRLRNHVVFLSQVESWQTN